MNRRDAIKLSSLGITSLLLAQHPMANMLNLSPLSLREQFGPDFKFGVATAAYQIEGAWNIDGKGPSIWDTFSHKKGKILHGDNGDVSCDFYHNYLQDLALLQSMNMDVFRFSTAWSRIMPEGRGRLNTKGIDFYHR
ncbi:MAG: family 1 glycosylhydrolase, partial [Chitinophagales bacterium]